MAKAPFYVHVHQGRMRQGLPPIIVRRGKRGRSVYAEEVQLKGTVKWSPLPCGARVAIECSEEPVVVR